MSDSDSQTASPSNTDKKRKKSLRETALEVEAVDENEENGGLRESDDDDLNDDDDDRNGVDNDDDDVIDDDDDDDSRPAKKQLKRLRRGNKDELEEDDKQLLMDNDQGVGKDDEGGYDSDSFIEHDIPEEYMGDDDLAYSRRENGLSEFQDVDNIFGDYEGLYSDYLLPNETDDSTKVIDEIKRKLKSTQADHDTVENYSSPEDIEHVLDDKPERYHLRLVGRREVQEDERSIEAEWIAEKLVVIIRNEISGMHSSSDSESRSRQWEDANIGWPGSNLLRSKAIEDINYEPNDAVVRIIKDSVASILEFIQLKHMEASFIWTYKRDYVHSLITRKHIWMIVDWDEEWERVHKIRNEIMRSYEVVLKAQQFAASQDIDGDLSIIANDLDHAMRELRRFQGYIRENEDQQSDINELLQKSELDPEAIEANQNQLGKIQSEISQYQAKAASCNDQIKHLKHQEASLHQMRLQKPTMDPSYANLVLKLFPDMCYATLIRQSTDILMLQDVSIFLKTLLTGTQSPEVRSEIISNVTGAISQEEAIDMRISKATLRSKTPYLRYKESRKLRDFIDLFIVPVCDVGEALRSGFVPILPTTPDDAIEEVAGLYLDDVCVDVRNIIRGAVTIVSEELGREPSIRFACRKLYHELATLSVELTVKGTSSIKTTDPLFPIIFGKNIKVSELLDGRSRYNFGHLEQARRQGLVDLSISIPSFDAGAKSLFYQTLKFDVLIDHHERSMSSSADSWAKLMKAIIEETMVKVLLPSFEREMKNDLLKSSYETIAQEASSKFSELLSMGPYRPVSEKPSVVADMVVGLDPRHVQPTPAPKRPEPDWKKDMESILISCPRKPFYGSVMSIFLDTDPRQAIFYVFVDRRGILRANGTIPQKLWKQQQTDLQKFIVENRPDVIILNSSGKMKSFELERLLKAEFVPRAALDIIENRRLERQRLAFNNDIDYDEDDDENFIDEKYHADVLILEDDLARLLKQSNRSRRFFAESHPNIAAAITMARFIQEPLAEYANLWRSTDAQRIFGWEALNLNLHPMMELMRSKGFRRRAIVHLERALIDAVSAVGVDLNLALNESSGDHFVMLLSFVPGLGPRKVLAMRDAVSRLPKKTIVARRELLAKNILGINVYNNAAGFLRIRNSDFEDVDNIFEHSMDDEFDQDNYDDFIEDDVFEKKKSKKAAAADAGGDQHNPLDNTRIHPECYNTFDHVGRICDGALQDEIEKKPGESSVLLVMKNSREELKRYLQKFRDSGYLENWHHGRPDKFDAVVKSKQTQESFIKSFPGEMSDLVGKLQLDNYAKELADSGEGQFFLYFNFIKEELRFPFLDVRRPFTNLTMKDSPWKNFVNDTLGGDAEKYYPGMVVRCTLQVELRNRWAMVTTDFGHRAQIKTSDFPFASGQQPGGSLRAVFLRYEFNASLGKYDIILSANEDHLRHEEVDWFGEDMLFQEYTCKWLELVRGLKCSKPSDFFGRYFNYHALVAYKNGKKADFEVEKQNESQSTTSASSSSKATKKSVRSFNRPINSEYWHNCEFKKAEEMLQSRPVGDVIFRPSSRAVNYDRFTMTWKVADSLFKHFDVFEKNKSSQNPMMLGKTLVVNDNNVDETFSSLDELYSSFAKPLADYTSLIVENRKFLAGTPDEVEAKLKSDFNKVAGFYYYIRHDPKRPGCFMIQYVVPGKSQVLESFCEPIIVRHNGYYYREHERSEPYNFPDDVCSQFKSDFKNNKLKKAVVKAPVVAENRTSRWSAATAAPSASTGSAMVTDSYRGGGGSQGASSSSSSRSGGGGADPLWVGGSSRHNTPGADSTWGGSSRHNTPGVDSTWGGSSRHDTFSLSESGWGSRHSTPAVSELGWTGGSGSNNNYNQGGNSNSRVINAPSLASASGGGASGGNWVAPPAQMGGGGGGGGGQQYSSNNCNYNDPNRAQPPKSRWGN